MKNYISLFCFLVLSTSLFSQAGELDPSFAEDGILNWNVSGSSNRGNCIEVQPDGKIVVGLNAGFPNSGGNDIAVVRINEDGSPDTTFGEDGVFHLVNPEGFDFTTDLKILEDGSILVSGAYAPGPGESDFILLKLTSEGVLDESFGADGVIIHPINEDGGFDYAYGLAINDEGKILVGGTSTLPGGSIKANTICRYHTNGVIDSTFGTNGIFIWNADNTPKEIQTIEIADDGNILASGSSGPFGTPKPSVYKVLADGSGLDLTFGTDGGVLAPFEGTAYGMIIHSNGNILLAGGNSNQDGRDLLILAYNQDGTPNTDFGFDGVFIQNTDVLEYAYAIREQQDGKIIAAGDVGSGIFSDHFYSVRIEANGTLDTSWGGEGYVITTSPQNYSFANDLAIQADGKVLLTGLVDNAGTKLQVVRYGNFIDADMDGYGLGDDCNDMNFDINPSADEIAYNGVDDDCNPETPDDDLDGDGFVLDDDCDDTNPNINPDAIEIPDNEVDEDCDGIVFVGINEPELTQQFEVYPNPTDEIIIIESKNTASKIESIEIQDYTGRIIKEIITTPIGNKLTVNMKSVPQGVSILTIHTTEGVVVKRVVKN